MLEAHIQVTLKPSVLDTQGKAIHSALHSLKFKAVNEVRAGKYFLVRSDEDNLETFTAEVRKMCDQVLVNPIIETYSFTIQEMSKA